MAITPPKRLTLIKYVTLFPPHFVVVFIGLIFNMDVNTSGEEPHTEPLVTQAQLELAVSLVCVEEETFSEIIKNINIILMNFLSLTSF